MKTIILASKSPRRKELLANLGLKFTVHPSNFKEKSSHITPKNTKRTPQNLVLHNAIGKAKDIEKHYKDALIIGVDTIVVCKNHVIGKPKNKEDAIRILKILSGTTHQVISGICLIDTKTGKTVSDTEITLIKMARLKGEEILSYVRSGEGVDKAAGYAIQGLGSLFIKSIEGDYFNVVGLPLYKLKKLFEKLNISIFKH